MLRLIRQKVIDLSGREMGEALPKRSIMGETDEALLSRSIMEELMDARLSWHDCDRF